MRTYVGLAVAVMVFIPSFALCKIGGGDVIFRPPGANPVHFKHTAHGTKAGLKCSDCHYKIYTTMGHRKKFTMKEMEQGLSCGACHNGKKAFAVTPKENCQKCHK